MDQDKLPDISIGDFAMDILKSMKNDPNSLKPSLSEATLQNNDVPNLNKIKVSNEFVSMVTGGGKILKVPIPIKESKEIQLESLIIKFSKLIVEAKLLMEEMSLGTTSVGNLGTSCKPTKKLKNKSNILNRLRNLKNA